jgi:hypothetical protein
MALTWVEDNESRSSTIVRLGKRASSTMTRSYKVFGTTDDVAVHAEANSRISSQLRFWQYPGRPDVQLLAESYSVSYLGDDAWQVTISYEKTGADNEDQPDPLRRSRSFDTSGGTQHITQSPLFDDTTTAVEGPDGLPIVTRTVTGERKYGPTGSMTPDQFGAIGVDGDSVAGVDIVVPALSWTETYDVPSSYVTANYIKRTAFMTGTVNNAAFRTFRAGEVLFLGCSGSQDWDSEKGDGPWSLSYKFVASPNAGANETTKALKIGNIGGIEKKGHEYLWVKYEATVGAGSADMLKRPKYVYVNPVYTSSNFAQLGIGVS